MKAISCRLFACFAFFALAGGCAHTNQAVGDDAAGLAVVAAPSGIAKPPFRFAADDEAFLNEVQHGAFNFLWNACDPATGMVYDRTSKDVISVGGVGFQLSAIPIGVERGWITRDQGDERARRILRSLLDQPLNRKAGHFYHYLDPVSAAPSRRGYEKVVSTIDSALLMAGALTAGAYFKGETDSLAQRLFDEADWRFFVPDPATVDKPSERGYVSLGWKPADKDDPTGPGALLPYYWVDSGDEHRLVAFLGVCAPRPEHRLDPAMYYRLRRALGSDEGNPPFVWFPWSGALFTAFFAHCWIDYAVQGPDEPARFAEDSCRTRVDWWENSRRIVAMHRRKAIANPKNLPTFGEHAWGLTATDAASGYIVPGLFPTLIPMPGCTPEFDFSPVQPADDFGDGTIAPYGAGCSIIFEPGASIAALRHYRAAAPALWHDPAAGGFGFRDSFNLGTGWIAPDCVAIDQGPMILLIENARNGNVWRWMNASPVVKQGKRRLGMR